MALTYSFVVVVVVFLHLAARGAGWCLCGLLAAVCGGISAGQVVLS